VQANTVEKDAEHANPFSQSILEGIRAQGHLTAPMRARGVNLGPFYHWGTGVCLFRPQRRSHRISPR